MIVSILNRSLFLNENIEDWLIYFIYNDRFVLIYFSIPKGKRRGLVERVRIGSVLGSFSWELLHGTTWFGRHQISSSWQHLLYLWYRQGGAFKEIENGHLGAFLPYKRFYSIFWSLDYSFWIYYCFDIKYYRISKMSYYYLLYASLLYKFFALCFFAL